MSEQEILSKANLQFHSHIIIIKAMSKVTLLLRFMHLLLIHTIECGNVHYVKPLPTTQCPEQSCLTLSTLAANSSDYFDPNTTVVFLEGKHTLDSDLFVSKINGSLTLLPNGSDSVAIICSRNTTLVFVDITQLQISRLEFMRCSSKVELVDWFSFDNSVFHGENNASTLHLKSTNTSIAGCSFVFNTVGTYHNPIGVLALYSSDNATNSNILPWLYPKIQSTSARVGGAMIVTNSTVTISSSYFENNSAKIGGAIYSQKGSNIDIINCTFVNNSATGCGDDGCHGGALFIDSGCTVTTHDSIFTNNTAGYGGGAIAIFEGIFVDSAHNVFSSNRAGKSGGAILAYNL